MASGGGGRGNPSLLAERFSYNLLKEVQRSKGVFSPPQSQLGIRKHKTFQAFGRTFTLDNMDDSSNNVSFQQAAREGNIRVIRKFLDSRAFKRRLEKFKSSGGKNPLDAHDNNGNAALHYAARYNNLDIIELLLDRGADKDVRDADGQTPLHHATRYAPKGTALNPEEIAFVPLGPGMGALEEDREGDEDEVVEDQPAKGEDIVVSKIKSFLRRTHTQKSMPSIEDQIAEEQGSPPIQKLAEHGCNVNAQDDYGMTPLHLAADRGNYAAVFQLLSLDNVQVDCKDNQGETALHMAVMFEDVACIRKLLFNPVHPCNPRVYSYSGMSPLHLAFREAGLDVIELVYERVKTLEMKETLDQLINDGGKEGQTVKSLLRAKGEASFMGYNKPISTLVKKLQELAIQEFPENGAEVREMLDKKVTKAMGQAELKMREHVNRAGEDRMTCLHLAVQDGRVEVIEFLLENGADVSLKSAERETALHIAANKGHLEVIKRLVEKGSPVEARNKAGETALHEAAKQNQTEIISYLLEKGASIEAHDKEGGTPLITASGWGHRDAVRMLLDAGADVQARDKKENSALFAAIAENIPSVVELLLNRGGEKMIDSELDRFQNTPLHFAAELGHLGCLRELIKFGFEINAQNEDDKNALHLAAEFGRKKCCMELVKTDKSTLSDKDDLGNIPLHYAALNGHVDTTIYLCEMGSEVGARNQNGWTPLDCAANKGNTKTMAALIDADAEIDPMDKAKLTPLHLAAKNGHVDAVLYLIDQGADITLTDITDLNALELAVMGNKKDVAEAILNSNVWMTALTNAQHNGDTPMKKLIRFMPDVAEVVMNRCVDLSRNPPERTDDNPNFEVVFNYKFITNAISREFLEEEDNRSTHSDDLSETESGSQVKTITFEDDYGKVHPISLMIRYKRKDLLSHPIVQSLVHWRWSSYGRHFYYSNLLFYCLFLICLCVYMLTQIPPLKPDADEKIFNCIDAANSTCYASKSPVVAVAGVGVVVFSILRLVIELLQIYFQRRNYLGLQNLVEIFLFSVSIYFTSNAFYPHEVISVVAWQLGVFCILCSWAIFLLFLRKFPGIGIYIVMFVEVLITFLKLMIVVILFIAAFGFTFHMVLSQFHAFETSPLAFLRTFVMMTGEFEFDSYFESINDLHYPEATVITFIVFVIIVPIVFMNLLVGLAVDDIKAVYDDAELQRTVMKIELLFQVENLLPSSYIERIHELKKTCYPNRRKKILGSVKLGRMLRSEYALPFNGIELKQLISFGLDGSEAVGIDAVKFKKLRVQVTNLTKKMNEALLMLRRINLKTTVGDGDNGSTLSSDMRQIMDISSSDSDDYEN